MKIFRIFLVFYLSHHAHNVIKKFTYNSKSKISEPRILLRRGILREQGYSESTLWISIVIPEIYLQKNAQKVFKQISGMKI